jgi:hypothetical protein
MAIHEIQPSAAMLEAAEIAGIGKLVFVYQDGTTIRAETEIGADPYVWRDGQWRRMIPRPK